MKKTIIFALAALMLLTAQCKKNEQKPESQEDMVMVPIHGTMSFDQGGSKTEITTAGYVTPVDGDKIFIYRGKEYMGQLTCRPTTGQQFDCEGTINSSCLGQECVFMYFGSNAVADPMHHQLNIADQRELSVVDGKIDNISKFHVGGCRATVSTEGTVTLPMITKIALGYFQLKDGSDISIASTDVTISGLYNQSGFYMGYDGSFSGQTLGDITVHTDANGRFFMAMIPQSGAVTFSFAGGGKQGTKNFPNGIRACRLYTEDGVSSPIVVTMAEPETDEWINFNDPAMGVEGLPIWAKYNVGVDRSNLDHAYDWYGDYYAWGEVEPYYTSINWTSATSGTIEGWKTDMTTGAGNTDLTSGYAWKSYSQGAVDDFAEWSTPPYDGTTKVLKSEYDAACVVLGGSWRMPTYGATCEWEQLASNTYFKWEYDYNDIDGLNGYVVYKVKDAADKGLMTKDVNYNPNNPSWVTYNQYMEEASVQGDYSASDPHMFLPATGDFYYETNLSLVGSGGFYWSRSLNIGDSYLARCVAFGSGNFNPYCILERYYGFTVRPVQ